MTIWFTSDQHFDHDNIITYCNRPFKNVDIMNREIIRRYQEVVKPQDIVYFLGDISLRTSDHVKFYRKLLQQLPGQKHLILGNHDSLKPFTYVDAGFISVHTSLVLCLQGVESQYILNHDPAPSCIDRKTIWLCGHVHDLFKRCNNVINVGVDVWDFYPVSLEIIQEMVKDGI